VDCGLHNYVLRTASARRSLVKSRVVGGSLQLAGLGRRRLPPGVGRLAGGHLQGLQVGGEGGERGCGGGGGAGRAVGQRVAPARARAVLELHRLLGGQRRRAAKHRRLARVAPRAAQQLCASVPCSSVGLWDQIFQKTAKQALREFPAFTPDFPSRRVEGGRKTHLKGSCWTWSIRGTSGVLC